MTARWEGESGFYNLRNGDKVIGTPPPPPRPPMEGKEATARSLELGLSHTRGSKGDEQKENQEIIGTKVAELSVTSALSSNEEKDELDSQSSSPDDESYSFVPQHMNVEGALRMSSQGSKGSFTAETGNKYTQRNGSLYFDSASQSPIPMLEKRHSYSSGIGPGGSSLIDLAKNEEPSRQRASKEVEESDHIDSSKTVSTARHEDYSRASCRTQVSENSSVTRQSYTQKITWETVIDAMQKKKTLEHLQLKNIVIEGGKTDIGEIELPSMPNLRKIEFVNVSFDVNSLGTNWLIHCPNLTELYMRNCGLTAFPPVDNAKELTLLDLRHNEIAWVSAPKMPKLAVLLLSDNQIKKVIDLRSLSIHSSLRMLEIYPNPLFASTPKAHIRASIRAYMPLLEILDNEKLVFNSPEIRKRNQPSPKQPVKLSGKHLKNSVQRLSTPTKLMRFRMEETCQNHETSSQGSKSRHASPLHSSKSLSREQQKSVLRLSQAPNNLRLECLGGSSTSNEDSCQLHQDPLSDQRKSFRRARPGERWIFGRPAEEPQRLDINSPSVITPSGRYPLPGTETGKRSKSSTLRTQNSQYKETGSFFNLQEEFRQQTMTAGSGASSRGFPSYWSIEQEIAFPNLTKEPYEDTYIENEEEERDHSPLSSPGGGLHSPSWSPTDFKDNLHPEPSLSSGEQFLEDTRLEQWHEPARELVISLGLILEFTLEQILFEKAPLASTLKAATDATTSIEIDIQQNIEDWIGKETPHSVVNALMAGNICSHETRPHLALALEYYGYLQLFQSAFKVLGKQDLDAVIRMYGVLERSQLWKLLKTNDLDPQEFGLSRQQLIECIYSELHRHRRKERTKRFP